MSAATPYAARRVSAAAGELGKLSAFLRRDFLTAWSYRATFFTDAAALFLQALSFYFVGLMVNPEVLPSYVAMARLTADRALASGRLDLERAGALLAVLGSVSR